MKKAIQKVKNRITKAPERKLDFSICPNCNHPETGKFCPNCGQANKDFNRPFREIFGDLMDSINLDTRMVRTLFPFFFRPGFLTSEYFKGRRKRYVPPMRLYIIVSILFFFFMQKGTLELVQKANDQWDKKGGVSSLDIPGFQYNIGDESDSDSLKLDSKAIVNEIKKDYNITIDGKEAVDKVENFVDELTQASLIDKKSLDSIKLNSADLVDEAKKDTTSSGEDKEIIDKIGSFKENRAVFVDRFYQYSSYAVFLLMPVFAFLLMLVYIRSKNYYVNHLIFSINIHSFVFAIIIMVFVLYKYILPAQYQDDAFYLIFLIPIYIYAGMKYYYKKGYIGTLFRLFALSFLYFLVVLTSFILMLVLTANDMDLL